MTATYLSGSLVRSIATFTNALGAAADPTTVTLKYSASGGPVTTAVYPAAPIIKDSAGVYHADLDTTGLLGGAAQQFIVEWKGAGAVQAIGTDTWNITPDPI